MAEPALDARVGAGSRGIERLLEPDVAALRRWLRDPGLSAVVVPWRSTLGVPETCGRRESEPALGSALETTHRCRAPMGRLTRRLRRSIRELGPEAVRAAQPLLWEVGFLARLLASVVPTGGRDLGVLLTPCREELCQASTCRGSRWEPAWSLTLSLGGCSEALLCRGLPTPEQLGALGDLGQASHGGPWLLVATLDSATFDVEPGGHADASASDEPRASRPRAEPTDVVLVSMPFADLQHPSIGLSLLRGTLPEEISAEILYFTHALAMEIGPELYRWIASGRPSSGALLGEWIFSAALGAAAGDPASYVEEVLRDPEIRGVVPEGAFPWLLRVRATATAFVDRCAESVLARNPRLVGLTSVFQQHAAALALARRLKEHRPDLPVVLGGANCEGVMGRALLRRFPWVDAVVSGEGEQVFPALVERLLAQPARADLRDLPGVSVRASVGVGDASGSDTPVPNAPAVRDLDALPLPDYDDHLRSWQASGLGQDWAPRLLFETARGCWWGETHHCTFCGLNGSGMAFRSKTPERALDELESLLERYPGLSVAVVDNILDLRYLRTLVPELARRRLGVDLFYEVKANLRKDQLRLLREAGIREIQPGIESLSDEVLRLMRKGVTGLQNLQLLKWVRELGMQVYWNFLWGFAGESPAEYQRMERWIPWLTHLQPPEAFGTHRLDRFSPNFFEGERLGYRDIAPYPAYRHVYGDGVKGDCGYGADGGALEHLGDPGDLGDLEDFAYYFRYDYRDGRDVESYVAGLRDRLEEWQDVAEGSDLVAFDRQASLLVFDYRPAAEREITVLEGLSRELYLACDAVRTDTALAREARQDVATVRATLAPLVEAGLLIQDGARYLALALPGRDSD